MRLTKGEILKRISEDAKGCWIWKMALDSKGYGVTYFRKKYAKAYRVSWVLFRGEIPKGKLICHRCDVRACVNPRHLFVGTYTDNARDAASKGRTARGPKNGASKLTEKQVLEILTNKTDRQKDIAKKYGVSATNIRDIKKRKIWKYLHPFEGRV